VFTRGQGYCQQIAAETLILTHYVYAAISKLISTETRPFSQNFLRQPLCKTGVWRMEDMVQLPSLNKQIVNVTSLDDIEEEKKYWISKSPLERIEAIEINRRMIYGQDRATSRLQRFFETSELT